MALSKVDLANQVENQLPQGLVANNLPYRNIIINGDMSIAQRGTSTASVASNGYFSCDRWRYAENSDAVVTISQDTDVPSGQGFANSFKIDITTADASLGASDNIILQQKFEGQMLQYLKKGTANAVSLTVSFWVKSTKTGIYIVQLYDRDNNRTIAKSYTIDVADTWENKTITYAGDTTGTLDNNNEASLELYFWLMAGSDNTSGTLATSWESNVTANRAVGQVNLADSTSNNFWITGVQLEAGTTASDFEFLPVDVNLQRCLRYLPSIQVKTYTTGGICLAADDGRIHFQLPVRARTAPTGISYDGTILFMRSNGALTGTGIAFATATEDVINIVDVGAASLVAGNATGLGTDSSNTRTILCTGCEL